MHSITHSLLRYHIFFAGTIGGLGAHGLGSAHMMGSEELQGIFSPSPRATPHTKASHQPTASTHDAHASFMQIHYNHEYQPKAQQGSSSSRTQHYADDSYTQELHDRHYTTGTHLLALCSAAADALSYIRTLHFTSNLSLTYLPLSRCLPQCPGPMSPTQTNSSLDMLAEHCIASAQKDSSMHRHHYRSSAMAGSSSSADNQGTDFTLAHYMYIALMCVSYCSH